MNTIVKTLYETLATQNIITRIFEIDDEEALLTFERNHDVFSLFLTNDYAKFSHTFFNFEISRYDEKTIFEENNYNINTLTERISSFIEAFQVPKKVRVSS